MQMVKVSADPDKAMILSKEGKRIAMRIIIRMVVVRMAVLRRPRVEPERPVRDGLEGMDCAESPRRTSVVVTIGRALVWGVSQEEKNAGKEEGKNQLKRDFSEWNNGDKDDDAD